MDEDERCALRGDDHFTIACPTCGQRCACAYAGPLLEALKEARQAAWQAEASRAGYLAADELCAEWDALIAHLEQG